MKPETLDALLLDRACGELTPDVGELLDAYVGSDPERIARAARLNSTVACARRALAAGPAEQTPADRGTNWHLRAMALRERRGDILRLAACVLLGAGLGWGGFALHSPAPRPGGRVSPPQVAAMPLAPRRDAAAFWSVDRARVEATWRSPYRLRWESPVRMPRVEEEP